MRYFLIFTTCALLGSCGYREPTTDQKDKTPIYHIADDDAGMNEAIAKARQSLGAFNKALFSKNANYDLLALKVRFKTLDDNYEHIWLSDIHYDGNVYTGVIDNLPEAPVGVNSGDTIRINADDITDWMYADKRVLKGGYTIRLLRSRMPKEERAVFDQENGLIIEEDSTSY